MTKQFGSPAGIINLFFFLRYLIHDISQEQNT